ncbi:MAG: superoxide dismutase family protein [Oscillospiraceae bacterium]|nr:superoxide dismutase family protein [Oscillospiraceae bacterium]
MRIPAGRPDAIALLTGGARGTVRFWQMPDCVLIEVRLHDLPQTETGFFAFHIHESAAGGHYDPAGLPHPRHAGDLPPLLACGQNAYLAVKTCRFRLRDILGRAAVIHSGPDDFRTQPSGNPGPKLAQGIICPFFQNKC